MARALPDLPMNSTVMIRLLRLSVIGMSDFFEPVFRAVHLSDNSFHVLCLLMASENGAESPSDLSEMVGTSRANMTRLIDELVGDGFVTRATAPRDGRRQIITITTAGRHKVQETVPRIAGPLQIGFSELSEKEVAQFTLLLRKLIVSFDKSAHALRAAA